MGYKVSERDIENMLTVMSPTVATQAHLPRRPSTEGSAAADVPKMEGAPPGEEPLEDVLRACI